MDTIGKELVPKIQGSVQGQELHVNFDNLDFKILANHVLTKVNKVAQKPDPRVPRNKKPDKRHEKKVNEGMKINCNFCGYQHEKSREKCPAWGKT